MQNPNDPFTALDRLHKNPKTLSSSRDVSISSYTKAPGQGPLNRQTQAAVEVHYHKRERLTIANALTICNMYEPSCERFFTIHIFAIMLRVSVNMPAYIEL